MDFGARGPEGDDAIAFGIGSGPSLWQGLVLYYQQERACFNALPASFRTSVFLFFSPCCFVNGPAHRQQLKCVTRVQAVLRERYTFMF